MATDLRRTRRASDAEVRDALEREPGTPWSAPDSPLLATRLLLHSRIDLEALRRSGLPGLPPFDASDSDAIERRCVVWAAGDYVRTEDVPTADRKGPAVCGLEHPKFGSVYLDLADHSYLHIGADQLVRAPIPPLRGDSGLTFELVTGKQQTHLAIRGALALDLELQHDTAAPPEAARAMLRACLPGIEDLVGLGLPLADLEALGMASAVHIWSVSPDGTRGERIARHECVDVRQEELAPALLAIPTDYRSLRRPPRDATAPRGWSPYRRGAHSVGKRPRHRPVTSVVDTSVVAPFSGRPSGTTGQAPPAPAMAAMTSLTGGGFGPTMIALGDEPPMPSCAPSTYYVTSVVQVEQALLDTVQLLGNMVGERLGPIVAARLAPTDPEDLRLVVTVPWLADMQAFSASFPGGDAVFCLLRDAPTTDDPSGGGTGLIDRAAEQLARTLLAADEPLPFGGAEDPVALPLAVQVAMAAVIADGSIAPGDRFDALARPVQARLREAVLAQRLAVFTDTVDGDFGEHDLPARSYALVHVRLHMESLSVTIGSRLLDTLQIELDPLGVPHIRAVMQVQEVAAVVHMERTPGLAFWITAGTVIVGLGLVGAVAAPLIVGLLIGMGPFGWAILATALAAAPAAALAAVAGGTLLLAAVAYLVWDETDLRLRLTSATLTSRLRPQAQERRIALQASDTQLEGELSVEVSSTIPSGMHQLFDLVVNAAVPHFDAAIRGLLAPRLGDAFSRALRELPYLQAPPPARITVPIPVENAPVDAIEVRMPQHRLRAHASNGVPARLLAMGALTEFVSPLAHLYRDVYPTLQPYLTQVDRDLREPLAAVVERRRSAGGLPVFGLALSQNLLNGIVFARWLSGALAIDFDTDATTQALAELAAACPSCLPIEAGGRVHAWAAGPPRVLVANRAYDEHPRRPYLRFELPDVRLCLSGIAGKESALEVRFAVSGIAHLAFGELAPAGDTRTLWTQSSRVVDVQFDRHLLLRIEPVETQGLAARGPGFDSIATLDASSRLALLLQLQPLVARAAALIVRQNRMRGLQFLPGGSVDRQRYDGDLVHAHIVPVSTSLHCVFGLDGAIQLALPSRDAQNQLRAPTVSLDGESCAEGIAYRWIGGP